MTRALVITSSSLGSAKVMEGAGGPMRNRYTRTRTRPLWKTFHLALGRWRSPGLSVFSGLYLEPGEVMEGVWPGQAPRSFP